MDTIAGVTNTRFGVRSTPRTARASAFHAVDQPVSASGEVDVEVASSDGHDRTGRASGVAVAATVAVRERSGRHDVAGRATPDGVTAAHRVAVVNLDIEAIEGRSRAATGLVTVNLDLIDGRGSAEGEHVTDSVAAGELATRTIGALGTLNPRSVGTVGHRTRIGDEAVEGNNLTTALAADSQLDVVDVEDELVVAGEVTDGDVFLPSEGTQVDAVVVPVALGTGRTTAANAHHIATALGGHRPRLNLGPVGSAVVGDEHTEVLGRIAGILSASPEAEGRASGEGHLRRHEVVIRSDGLVRGIAVGTRADQVS